MQEGLNAFWLKIDNMAFCVMTKSAAISQKSVAILARMLFWVNWDEERMNYNENWRKQAFYRMPYCIFG
jgi:hypothetical protein